MLRRLTASKCQLALNCAYWLRTDVPLAYEPAGPAAEEGTALHAMIEACLRDQPAPSLESFSAEARERIQRKWAAWKEWARDQKRDNWEPEVAFRYSPVGDEASRLTQTSHRDYSGAKPGDVAMQVDVASFDEDAVGTYAEAIDWKSGRRQAVSEDNAQLGVAALALSRCYGVDRVRVRLVYCGEDAVDVDEAWLESFDLDMLRHKLRRVLETEQAEPTPGAHCVDMWCPARTTCPATQAAMVEVSGQPLADIKRLVASALVTPEDAGRAYVQLRIIKDAVRAVDERIKRIVETHGEAPTTGGKVLRLATTTRETFSRARLPKDRADEVLGMLRDVGALTESTSTYVREGNGSKR